MVLGTSSGAGKSWLCTALCRWYARQGFSVAPFKAQNMSNNARVVEGGEIGSAQYFQALAAGVLPRVQMNPLLLKPEADTRSQVVLLGKVDADLTAMPWRARCAQVWPVLAQALDSLRQEHDVVVIEGAGSPAEINLQSSDVVNLRVARYADAACLLVSDIDRGGAFAHLYGTWALMAEADRQRLRGFVLNRFRGDARLLAPAPERLQAMTGVSVVATVPLWTGHGLPEEDGWFQDRDQRIAALSREEHARTGVPELPGTRSVTVPQQIALLVPPYISNLDEFEPLSTLRGVQLVAVRATGMRPVLSPQDWIILPGSKRTSADLGWLRAHGLDAWVKAHAAGGGQVLGVCGGLQILGRVLLDPLGMDGPGEGLGLLPLQTCFEQEKVLQHRTLSFGEIPGAWHPLSGLSLSGYEIHQGRTVIDQRSGAYGNPASAAMSGKAVLPDALGWCNTEGNVLGIYLHGLFENDNIMDALFGQRARPLREIFDGLADHVAQSFSPGVLEELLSPNGHGAGAASGEGALS
ncbi:MAG: cobyric acid synthase [Lautropia sp.]|nr:cobyric acid synthase [Lautropia sp.]